MGSPSRSQHLAGRAILLCLGLVCAQALLAAAPAEAQIWVVTGVDGTERFTSRPEPGARVYMPTRHSRTAVRAGASAMPFAPEIVSAAAASGLEAALVRAVIAAESAFDPQAMSPKGAQGLMQLMPATAAELGVGDVWDPNENIRGGSTHLARLVRRYGDVPLALAAYNAGEGAVDRYGGIPPFRETQTYVQRVLAYYRRFGGPSD